MCVNTLELGTPELKCKASLELGKLTIFKSTADYGTSAIAARPYYKQTHVLDFPCSKSSRLPL